VGRWRSKHKINKIKEFYRRNPDAPMQIPKVDSDNLPIKNMLEQSLPKISCQNKPSNNPSPQMQGHDNRNKITSQETYMKPFIKTQEESGYYGQNQPSSLYSMSLPTTRAYDTRNKIADQKTDIQGIQNRQDLNRDAKQPLMRTGLANRSEENLNRKDLPKNYWVVKRAVSGDIIDCYRVEDDLT
jgi:hypothetical protein